MLTLQIVLLGLVDTDSWFYRNTLMLLEPTIFGVIIISLYAITCLTSGTRFLLLCYISGLDICSCCNCSDLRQDAMMDEPFRSLELVCVAT